MVLPSEWNRILWIVFGLCLVVILFDNYYWIKDGTWFSSPTWSAVTIFKWVAIVIICYVLIQPSSLGEVPTITTTTTSVPAPADTVADPDADVKERT